MFRNNKEGLRFITLLMAIVMIAMVILPAVPVEAGVATNETYVEKATITLNNIYNHFIKNGELEDSSYNGVDALHAFILQKAGAEPLSWKAKNNKLLRDLLNELISSTPKDINADRLAKLYIAAKETNITDNADEIFIKLKNKHTKEGTFGDKGIYVDFAVYDILNTAGKLQELDNLQKSINYIINSQKTEGDGKGGFGTYPDFVNTLQATRALHGLLGSVSDSDKEKIRTAIELSLEWVKSQAQTDGSFVASIDNPIVDTAEVLTTISQLNLDTEEWKGYKQSALDYLSGLSKKDYERQNVDANARALRAFVLQGSIPDKSELGGVIGSDNVTIRIEGPNYTILPETKVNISLPSSMLEIIKANASKYGYTAEGGNYNLSINGISNPGWVATPDQSNYVAGDSFVLYGGKSANIGNISLTKTTVEPLDSFKVTVNDKKGKPVEGATVIYYKEVNRATPVEVDTTTDINGNVDIKIDSEGIYSIAAHKISTAVNWVDPDDGLVRTLPKTITVQKYQPPAPVVERIKVYIAVLDDDGKIIYGPDSVRLNKDDKFGFTALGALDETGLRYDAGKNNDFVTDIERIKNKGLSGWMFAVNGRAPGVGVRNYEIKDGDEVLWYYSKSESSRVPSFPDEKDKEKQDKEEEKEKEKDKVVTPPNYVIPPKRTFPDVGANIPWAKEAIEVLAGRGIISGTGTGQFEPNRSINRAEFAKLVVETLGNKSLSQGSGMFSDVDSAKWYADYIGKAFATGLIEGSNGKFRPLENITRNEVAVMLHRMQNKVVPNNGIISFKDEKEIPNWARLSVAYAIERGLIKGYDDNTFKGNQPMTRAEVAVVLYRYIQMMNL